MARCGTPAVTPQALLPSAHTQDPPPPTHTPQTHLPHLSSPTMPCGSPSSSSSLEEASSRMRSGMEPSDEARRQPIAQECLALDVSAVRCQV